MPLSSKQDQNTNLICAGCRFPVFSCHNGKAHLAFLVHIGVVDLSLERDLGRLEGVLSGEGDVDFEGAFTKRGRFRDEEPLPLKDILLLHDNVAERL